MLAAPDPPRRNNSPKALTRAKRESWQSKPCYARPKTHSEAIAREWHQRKRDALTPRYAGQVLDRLEADVRLV
jgi:hypothetical protein